MSELQDIGLYIHWPFCQSKCPYCDFNSHVRENIDSQLWLKAYKKALTYYAHNHGLDYPFSVTTVFFGGGTPSTMEPFIIEGVLEEIHKFWPVAKNCEITLEANPTSVDYTKFSDFKKSGINRISLGAQSFRDEDLQFLGRKHSVNDIKQAIKVLQKNDFRYNVDLIYARPNQKLKDWMQELELALSYAQGHMSLYQLTIERGTVFYQDFMRKRFVMPEEELSADFYISTQEQMYKQGYDLYEVSNYAKKGQECQHNLIYWRYKDYLGIGPGAHGRLSKAHQKFTTREHQVPEIWLDKVLQEGNALHPMQALSFWEQEWERIMMGLRLKEGIIFENLEDSIIDLSRLSVVEQQGWVNKEDMACNDNKSSKNSRISLNLEGLLRLNAILKFLLLEEEAFLQKNHSSLKSNAKT